MPHTTPEFFKLDAIDKQVLFWLMDNKPDDLESWANEIALQYHSKNIKINPDHLILEVRQEMEGTIS